MSDQLDKIIRERVSINEAAYKRIFKSIQALPNLRFSCKEEIESAKKEIDNALSNYEVSVFKFQLQRGISGKEIANYEAEQAEIRDTYDKGRTVTLNLESELSDARKLRSQLEEYDRFTRKMASDRLRTRAETIKALQRLETEIRELEAEKEEYAKVWTARREQFSEIVSALQGMQRQIREEKEEQDRREGMDETEEGEAVEVPKSGVQSVLRSASGSATPNPLVMSSAEEGMGEAVTETIASEVEVSETAATVAEAEADDRDKMDVS
ncbi:hypothetical protein POJ06DRAFT_87500 [Lipomyces tetrasporus]|uniref:THO complex subunit 7 n=1 Tax=Lipomyces tetrasporus TaxID=54092 RepID=A0AAD7QTI6_9ASCO|nr:uncharacterized protein POJ06DRAFT_87500 [Lipomyces tetrasporus]KAJ8101054.1 hypothetical protein POJ06DRAFT_87500 [Lipomyces tetrasporus]